MPKKVLIFLFFVFSGFARVSYTKIYGIQIFVVLAIIYLLYSFLNREKDNVTIDDPTQGSIEYKKFLIWSLPALGIGLYFAKTDALYFYVYSVLPYLLYLQTKDINYNLPQFLWFAEFSVLIVIFLGWAIYFGYLPINFLFNEVTEAEYGLGYWGISYLASSRNHDYMYPLVCTAISIFLFKNSSGFLKKSIQLTVFGICEITLLASLARGGMIASFVYAILMFKGLSPKERRAFVGCLIVVLFLFWGVVQNMVASTFENIFLSIFGITKETQYGGHFSNDIRKEIYSDAITSALLNPIGYGIQNFSITSRFGGGSAENAYLTILIERGWFATYFFIMFLWKKWRELKTIQSKGMTLNYYLVPSIAIYFLFNYEFTSYMCVFVFYLMMISSYKFVNNR